jgi:chromosome partitioning protein
VTYQVVTGLGWPAIAAPKSSEPIGWIGSVSRETSPVQEPTTTALAEDESTGDESDGGDDDDPSTVRAEAPHVLAAAAGRSGVDDVAAPEQTRVLVVANQKGGVGKTTTAVNIAAALAQRGLRVLVIDLDPQGNASTALSIAHPEGTPGTYEVLVDSVPLAAVVTGCPDIAGLSAVPATIDLAGAEVELVPVVARETRLRSALTRYLDDEEAAGRRFDYVFIDCPPSLGLLTVNALTAGEELLIPIQCEYYALEGLTHLLQTIEQVRLHLNPHLRIAAIVLTMFDARTRLSAGVADEVRRHFGASVLRTAVPRSVRISEAPGYGQTVLTYDPGSAGALSYWEVAAELAAQPVGALS